MIFVMPSVAVDVGLMAAIKAKKTNFESLGIMKLSYIATEQIDH
jgi:hypothetical protein